MPNRVTVLVVTLVLVVCGGLLAVSICRVRDAAERLSCTNNLSQLGLALQFYHNDHGSFPTGTLVNRLPPEKRFSWLLLIMPYFEARPRLLLDTTRAWDAEENRLLKELHEPPKFPEENVVPAAPVLPLFCPSNPNRLQEGLPSFTHYVGIAGLGLDAAALPKEAPSAGVFGYERATALKDIKDPANTLLLAETALNNGPWTAGGPPTVRGLDPSRPYIGHGNQFGGTHPGGVNVLFADGSVRFLDEAMDPKLLEGMATIDGEETRDNNAP